MPRARLLQVQVRAGPEAEGRARHQQQITIREIKFRPKIAQNDYDTKKGHVTRFLLGKDKVKITIMFRGREVTHPERGTALLDRLAEELSEIAVVEQSPIQDGRNMTMLLAPSKAVLAGEKDHHDEDDAETARAPRRARAEAKAEAGGERAQRRSHEPLDGKAGNRSEPVASRRSAERRSAELTPDGDARPAAAAPSALLGARRCPR